MLLRIDRLTATLAIATLFMPAFRLRTGTVDLYLYYALLPVILLLTLAAWGRIMSKGLVVTLALLGIHSAVSIVFFAASPTAALTQLLGIGVMSAVFYSVLALNRFDLPYLFSLYLTFARVAVAIALIQILSYAAGFRAGYDLDWLILDYYQSYSEVGLPRIQSVFSEPSHFALLLTPAVFVSLESLSGGDRRFIGKAWACAIVVAAVLTFSAMAYIGILFSLAMVALGRGLMRRTIVAGGAVAVATFAYGFVPEIQLRVDDTLGALLDSDLAEKNLSTLTLINNWHVALANLRESWLFGGGLGSHPAAFQDHSLLLSDTSLPMALTMLNAADANSLLIRMISELGLPGLIAMAGLLLFFTVRGASATGARTPEGDHWRRVLWLISNASLAFLAMALVRQGHYFALGTPFFLLLYVYCGVCAPLAEMTEQSSHTKQAEGALT